MTLIILIIYFHKRVDTRIPAVITATSRVTLDSNWKTCLSFSTPVSDKPRVCALVTNHLVALKQVGHCLKHPQCCLWWHSSATLCASVGTITLCCALRRGGYNFVYQSMENITKHSDNSFVYHSFRVMSLLCQPTEDTVIW